MTATLPSWPKRVSNPLWCDLPRWMMVVMLPVHALYVSSVREIISQRVFICQPMLTFVSSMAAAVYSLLIDTKPLRGIGSSGDKCQPTVWIARRTAARTRFRTSVSSMAMVGISSMYSRALQQHSTSGLKIVCKAEA